MYCAEQSKSHQRTPGAVSYDLNSHFSFQCRNSVSAVKAGGVEVNFGGLMGLSVMPSSKVREVWHMWSELDREPLSPLPHYAVLAPGLREANQ
jgi:hypothetical protein